MGGIKKRVLNKIASSSLTEVIVATVLLMLVFGISLITMNTILTSVNHGDTHKMDAKIEKLIYRYKNNLIKIPLNYREDNLTISIISRKEKIIDFIEFRIVDNNTKKESIQKIIGNEN